MAKSKRVKRSVTQYTRNEDSFMAVGETTKTLASGAYKLGMSPHGDILFEIHDIRLDDIVKLPDGPSGDTIREVQRFWGLSQTYAEFGFVHKRGFLMYGPPGTGKSSTVGFVALDVIQHGGIVLYVYPNRVSLLTRALQEIRAIEPKRKIVIVLEDLDKFFEDNDAYGYGAVLLSILDGENSVPGVLFIATTNYMEQLDPRITRRPSRFDRLNYVGPPSKESRKVFLESKIPAGAFKRNPVEKWLQVTDGFMISMLKELIILVEILGQDLSESAASLAKTFTLRDGTVRISEDGPDSDDDDDEDDEDDEDEDVIEEAVSEDSN